MEARLSNPRILPAATFLLCHLLNSLLLLRFLPKTLLSWLFNVSSKILPPSPPSSPSSVVPASSAVSFSSDAMDTTELRRVFGMFDRNGDGRITRRELSESLESLGMFVSEKELEGMIEKIDVDGDGCVDVGEFRELYREIMEEREGEEEDMREAFGVFDADGDGYITVEELRAVLASLGLKQGRTVDECERMIGKVDADGDGVVDFQEFKQMMRGGGLAALSH